MRRPSSCSEAGRLDVRLSTAIGIFIFCLCSCAVPAFATTIVDKGTIKYSTSVDCSASIIVSENVHYREGEADYPKGISISCTDVHPDQCCWLQFVYYYVKIVFKDASKKDEYISKDVNSESGSFSLTTDPDKPKWHVDSGGYKKKDEGKAACYEDSFSHTSDSSSLTIFDQPLPKIIIKKPKPDVDRIEAVGHFQDYLICDKKICGFVEWESVHTFKPDGTEKGPEYSIMKPKKKDKLEDDQKTTLGKEYKDQKIM